MGFVKIGSNRKDSSNILNVLKNIVIGDKPIVEHSETSIYNKDDLVSVTNADGSVNIYKAKENNITGPFDISKWISQGGSTDIITISNTKPGDDTSYAMWLKPIREKNYNLPANFK